MRSGTSTIRIPAIAVLLLASSACVSRPPLRGVGAADLVDVQALASNEEAYGRVQARSLEPPEPNGGYTLSFVEFDARGRPARDGQIETASESIRGLPASGSAVVLFVHGWGHSADARDSHVQGFRDALSGLARALPDRTVAGIYVSWPARWLKKPAHFLTFWDRSRVANRAGTADDVRDVLRQFGSLVEEQRDAGKDVVSVAVGHSLGGKFLFSPMEERLEGDTGECLPDSPDELPLFGDLVLLVNPAQDVHDFAAFTDYACSVPEATRPVVVILSSEGDGVVGRTFLIARTLRNIVTPWNWDHFRSESVGLGWYERQVTHTLRPRDGDDRDADGRDATCHSRASCDGRLEQAAPPVPYGETVLRSCSSRQGPFIVVRVDARLVKDHSDMFNQPFLSFVRSFVAGNVRMISREAPQPAAATN